MVVPILTSESSTERLSRWTLERVFERIVMLTALTCRRWCDWVCKVDTVASGQLPKQEYNHKAKWNKSSQKGKLRHFDVNFVRCWL